MITELLKPDENSINKAVELLKSGEVVAVPTETVYGLAANAFDSDAIKKVFEAKGRPQDNPLILHISSFAMLKLIAKEIPPLAVTLAEKFWPGSLTMIFEKKDNVPYGTTGGLETAAVRMPDNESTLCLIEKCGFPLAAPSANISGLPSPTNAQHVYSDMNGKIPLILDGGACSCGVESTVICFTEKGVRILRPGAVTPEMLREYCDVEIDRTVLHSLKSDEKPVSPGTKYKHYSPKAEVFIVETQDDKAFIDFVNSVEDETAVVLSRTTQGINKKTLAYGSTGEEEANAVFASLRLADEIGARSVYVRAPRKEGIGLAVYNRLLRAAAFRVIEI